MIRCSDGCVKANNLLRCYLIRSGKIKLKWLTMSLFWLIRTRYVLHIQRADSLQGGLSPHNPSTVGSLRWSIWGGGGKGLRFCFQLYGVRFIGTLMIGVLFSQQSYNLPQLTPEWGVQRWKRSASFHLLFYIFSQSRGDLSCFSSGQTVNSPFSHLYYGPCLPCVVGQTVPP